MKYLIIFIALLIVYVLLFARLQYVSSHPEDFNKDGKVDMVDYSIFLSRMDK